MLFKKDYIRIQFILLILVILLPIVLLGIGYVFFFGNTLIEKDEDVYWTLREESRFYRKSKKAGWHKINLGVFEIEMPKEYYYFQVRGIDSFVGEIATKNRKFLYSFDYGWYSNTLESYHSNSDYNVSIDTLKGKFARVVLPLNEGDYTGLYISNIQNDNSLMIMGKGLSSDEAIYTFKNLKIRSNGYTSYNFGKNFSKVNRSIRRLFQYECSQCHGIRYKYVSQFTLEDMSKKDELFLKKFIYDSKNLQYDFPDLIFEHDYSYLKEEELELLVQYIKSFK